MILNDLDSADFTLFAFTAICVIFTVVYAGWARWRAPESRGVGVPFLVTLVGVTLVLGQISLSVLTESQYPFRDIVRNLIYGSGCLAMLAFLVVLLRNIRRDRRRRRDADRDRTSD